MAVKSSDTPISTRKCARCGRLFSKDRRYSQAQWDEQSYCSHHCARYARCEKPILPLFFNQIRVDPITKCWIWTGPTDEKGYGLVTVNQKTNRTHRALFSITVSDIPKGMKVLHRCDVPACCNPYHLFLGTVKDNADDMMMKGRGAELKGTEVWNARLTEAEVLAIRADSRTQEEIAATYQIAQTTVSAIKRRANWGHLPD